MKVSISVNIPEPKEIPAGYKEPSLLEKVQEYIKCVESGEGAPKEWYYLQRLYELLQQKKKLSKE